MYERIIISIIVTALTVYYVTPKIMKYFKLIGLIGIDQAKKRKPVIPESGGTAIAFGFFSGIMTYLAITTFIIPANVDITLILAALVTVQTIALIGFFDDIITKKTMTRDVHGDKNYRIGLRQRTKALLVLPAAVPLMVINAGHSTMAIPFIGTINFGILYPLFLIPIGVLCVANAVNMLAGLNGLESGMTTIALTGLGIYAYMNNETEAAIIALVGAAAFLTFLYYNKYPAKIFPGDTGTYLAGALIAAVVIIGNIEKFGIIIFTPWIIEAFIKLKTKFKGTSFGKLTKQGYLKPKNNKIQSLTHAVMNAGNYTEKQVVWILWLIEAAFVTTAFILAGTGII